MDAHESGLDKKPLFPQSDGMITEAERVSRFSVGAVIGRTFSILVGNPLPYLFLSLLACVPTMLIYAHYGRDMRAAKAVDAIVGSLIALLFTATLAYCVYQDLLGKRAGLWKSICHGLSRYFSLLGLSVAMFLGAMALVLIMGVFGVIGMLLGIVAILFFVGAFCVAIPVCVTEGAGVGKSLERSMQLTSGHRLSIVGLIILKGIVQAAVDHAASLVPDLAGFVIKFAVVAPLFTALVNVGIAVLYFQLRADKENTGIDKLTNVFD